MDHPISEVIDTNTLSLQHAERGARLTSNAAATAPTLYAGLFAEGLGGSYLWTTKDWNAFEQKNKELTALEEAWCLGSIETQQDDSSTTWFTGVWNQLSLQSILGRYTDWDSFMIQFNSAKPSMHLLDFDIHPSGGTRFYTGSWGSGPIDQRFVHDVGWDEFTAQWKTLSIDKWRLTKVQLYPVGALKTWHATGLYEKADANGFDMSLGRYDLVSTNDWDSFSKKYQSYEQSGPTGTRMRLIDFQVFDDHQGGKRYYVGVYRETSFPYQVLFSQDWGSLVNQREQLAKSSMRLNRVTRYRNQIQMPDPDWNNTFKTLLGDQCNGYCGWQWHGNVLAVYPFGLARAQQDWPTDSSKPVDKAKAPQAFTIDTRFNLASVSKPITAVAVMKLLHDYGISVDEPFYKLVKDQFPTVGLGVDKVTIRNLLQMKSGMVVDQSLSFDNIWTFLADYLKTQNVQESSRGIDYRYSNTNFTILQVVIDCVTGHGGKNPDYYTTYVSEKVLKPMYVDTKVFNPVPDPPADQALYYGQPSNHQKGISFSQFPAVAAAGWITSARELSNFMFGVYNGWVLDRPTTEFMFDNQLGWYKYEGVFGQYFHHNGGFGGPAADGSSFGLSTAIMFFPNRCGALLLVNNTGIDTIGTLAKAYETRVVTRKG